MIKIPLHPLNKKHQERAGTDTPLVPWLTEFRKVPWSERSYFLGKVTVSRQGIL